MTNEPAVDTRVLGLLQEITSLLRDVASFTRREDLAQLLSDQDRQTAYELSDGSRTAAQIVKAGKLSITGRTVRRWWDEWVQEGIAERGQDRKVRSRYSTFVLRRLPNAE